MNFTEVDDFARKAADAIGRYRIEFILSKEQLSKEQFGVAGLTWSSIPYGDQDIENVPDDKRGIYAFAVCKESTVLPPHGYVLYIGIAGRKSDRSLRARYRDYLNEKKILKRDRIALMIGTWRPVLRFYFATVDDEMTSDELELLEEQLNAALLPPKSVGDLEAGIKRQRRAFR